MAFATIAGLNRGVSVHSHNTDYFSHTLKSTVREPVLESLPMGFPERIVSPTAWTGTDFKSDFEERPDTLALDAAQVRELEQACDYFKELKLPFEDVSPESFPLPTLGSKLERLAQQLTTGVGFFHIRGLDPQQYSNQTNVILYLGIAAYIGTQRGRQDEFGNMLLHLTDLGPGAAPDNERQAPYSNVGQPFHTDTGDIIALYSLGEAECGGESQLVSTATVYNEIAKTRPDIIRLLSSPSWIFDRFGQWPPYSIRPILYNLQDDRVLLSFSRRPLVGSASSPRSENIPDLSALHIDAINMVQSVAERHALAWRLKPGDILFWNNLALLHSRVGFTDTQNKRRHLLRLWLRNDETEKGWPIPDELQASWNEAFDHAGRPQLWPVEPIREREYIINQQRSSGHS